MQLRHFPFLIFAVLALLNLSGCSDNALIVAPGSRPAFERRIVETGNPDTAAMLLLRAKEEGKVLESIEQLRHNRSGWKIRFTDSTVYRMIHAEFSDSTLELRCFINSPCSYLYVDQDTMWSHVEPQKCVMARITNNHLDRPIQQYNYSSGEQTEDGYIFGCYRTGSKNRYIRLTNSLFRHGMTCLRDIEHVVPTNLYWEWKNISNYHMVVSAILENTLTGKTTICLENDTDITFDMVHEKVEEVFVDSSVVIVPTCLEKDSMAVIPFSVSPTTAVFSHNVDGAAVDVQLFRKDADGLQPSTHVHLSKISHKLNPDKDCIEEIPMERGQYLATLQDMGTDEQYWDEIVLEITVRDSVLQTEKRLLSEPFVVTRISKHGPALPKSQLPVVYIKTPDGNEINSKTVWLKNATIHICQPDGSVLYEGTTSIRGRGNSSWSPPKKPYNLKLDEKATLLGMPADKRWCLLAEWYDRTLIRDAVARRISEVVGMEWTPKGEFVELVLNGIYVGCYYFCEKIKVSPDRVNIHEMSRDDNSGDNLTGGYLAEVDIYYDEPVKFRSAVMNFPYMIHSPDSEDITLEQMTYFQNYIGELEASLYDDERFARGEHRAYIDFDSFIRYWFVMELTFNSEISQPKSVWLYKDRQNRLKIGPVWDFDYGTFKSVPGSCTAGAFYYDRLFSDKMFVARVKALWATCRPKLLDVAGYIDMLTEKVETSVVSNDALWSFSISEFPVEDTDLSFREAAIKLKQAYLKRLQWLDDEINNIN